MIRTEESLEILETRTHGAPFPGDGRFVNACRAPSLYQTRPYGDSAESDLFNIPLTLTLRQGVDFAYGMDGLVDESEM